MKKGITAVQEHEEQDKGMLSAQVREFLITAPLSPAVSC